jgi:DNA-binding XRE family transcriptional regulator
MPGKKTVRYKFDPGAETSKFKEMYDTELDRLRLAHRIAELLEKHGLTQAQLAHKVGTTQAGISRLENQIIETIR